MSGTLRQWTTVVGSVRNNWWPPHRCGKRWYQRPVDQVWESRAQQWQTIMGINLTGVWHTLKAAAPIMIDQSLGGSIILVCSVGRPEAASREAHYVAAKHGLVGLCNAAALELGPFDIRVNLHPPVGR
jgi:NAD(P)-dependent dehydrogenase (short-subunit alcohol dehydrogenase family)